VQEVHVSRRHLQAVLNARSAVTASIGATTFPSVSETVDEMIGAADEAMYAVKRGTKNGVYHRVVSSSPRPSPSQNRALRA
jgi:GGDEF domain-containing protein